MSKYCRKVQVLLTEEQFRELVQIAGEQGKKLGVLVREAIEECHLKRARRMAVARAADRLLSLPEQPVPENYEEWESEYQKGKYSEP